MPVRGRSVLIVVFTLALILGMMPALSVSADVAVGGPRAAVNQQLAQPKVVVNTSFMNVRSGPGPIYTVIGVVPGGTELPVVGRNRDTSWWQVESAFGIGWVYSEFVVPRGDFTMTPVVAAAGVMTNPKVAVVGPSANVYMYPDALSGVVGVAMFKSEMTVIGRTGDGEWWQVDTNIGRGWVMQEAVALRGDASLVPVVSASASAAPSVVSAAPAMSGAGGGVAFVYGAGGVQMKSAPDHDAEGAGWLEFGEIVPVLSMSSDGVFAQVRNSLDRTGWVVADDVALSDPSDWRSQVFFYKATNLDLRVNPSMTAAHMVTVPQYERLVVVDQVEGWYLLSHALGTGWAPISDVALIYSGPQFGPSGQGGGGAAAVGEVVAVSGQPRMAAAYIIVNTSFLNIRSGPGASYTSVATVPGGTELVITGSTPDTVWFRVSGAFGSGWVNSEFVIFRGVFDVVPIIRYSEAAGSATGVEAIVSAPVNVYNGVGVSSGLLGTAPAGYNLVVKGRTADSVWLMVETNLGTGWLLASTVVVRGNVATVPVTG